MGDVDLQEKGGSSSHASLFFFSASLVVVFVLLGIFSLSLFVSFVLSAHDNGHGNTRLGEHDCEKQAGE